MRFNKQELVTIASQTPQNFDREGILVLKERQDGFFRRAEGEYILVIKFNLFLIILESID